MNSHSRTTSKHLFLQILTVTLKHSSKTVTVNALLDSGPDTTIISENVAQYLGLQGEKMQVEIKSALSKTVHFNTKMVSFEIVTDNGNSNININAYTASHLDVPTVKYNANEIKNQYQHLRDIPFCDISDDNVGLLIGTNYAELRIHRDFRVGDLGDPIAVKTLVGWMLVGGSKFITKNSISYNSLLYTTRESLNQNMKKFWHIDSYGTVPESQLISQLGVKKTWSRLHRRREICSKQ